MHEQAEHSAPPLPLLLFHGLLSTPAEFGLITHALRGRGLALECPRLPGYSAGNGAPVLDWRRWRDSAVARLDSAGAEAGPVVVGGLCAGGVLAAAAALASRQPVAGVVLISPTFTYDGWGLSRIRHLRRLGYWTGVDRFFHVQEREPYGVKNPRIRHWLETEMRRHPAAVAPLRLPLRGVRECERMMANVRTQLGRLDCPLLVIHAREDEITRLDSVRRLFDALPCADKELVVLEDSYHMVTLDNDRHKVVAQLERFVRRVSAPVVAAPLPDRQVA